MVPPFNDLEWPLTQISRSGHFWSRISEKRHILKTKLLFHTNRQLYLTWNCTMWGDLDWPLTRSHGFVSISWVSCFKVQYVLHKSNEVQSIKGSSSTSTVSMYISFVAFNYDPNIKVPFAIKIMIRSFEITKACHILCCPSLIYPPII